MKIDETQKLWMSDVLIPDLFITDYLPQLSPEAVKVYLYAKHVALNQLKFSNAELLAHLGMDEPTFKNALLDLAQHQVVNLLTPGDGFSLNDIKEMELLRQYQSAHGPRPSETLERLMQDEKKTELIRQISDTFYHGMMGTKTLRLIDECLHDFAFEPAVIYALFSEAMAKGMLNHYKYIEAIAKAWHENGIHSYSELKELSKRRDEIKRVARRVGKKLNRNMGEAEENIVRRWLWEYGYAFNIISLALERSVRTANANLLYFDKILESWHAAGLKSPAEIEAYEARRAEQNRRDRRSTAAPKADGPSFSDHEYSDDELEQLVEYLSVDGAEALS